MTKPPLILKRDIAIIFIITLIALISYFVLQKSDSSPKYAKICIDGKAIEIICLDNANDRIFSIESIEGVEFEIKDREIRIKSSDCSDKICVNTGFISKTNETAICLPKKLTIVIESNDNSEFDAVVG